MDVGQGLHHGQWWPQRSAHSSGRFDERRGHRHHPRGTPTTSTAPCSAAPHSGLVGPARTAPFLNRISEASRRAPTKLRHHLPRGGMPMSLSGMIQVGLPSAHRPNRRTHQRLRLGGRSRQLARGARTGGRGRRITPWNYPLYQMPSRWRLLAAGCTVVLKPSEVARLTLRLARSSTRSPPPGV